MSSTAAAASLRPAALPAVTVKPSISGWRTLSSAMPSSVRPRRGCSSVSKRRTFPSGPWISTGTICDCERARVDALDRASVAVDRPLVHVRAREPRLDGRVVPDGDGHVEGRRVRRLRMRGRHPGLRVRAGGEPLLAHRHRAHALGSTRQDDAIHAGRDRSGSGRDGPEAGCAVSIRRQPRNAARGPARPPCGAR